MACRRCCRRRASRVVGPGCGRSGRALSRPLLWSAAGCVGSALPGLAFRRRAALVPVVPGFVLFPVGRFVLGALPLLVRLGARSAVPLAVVPVVLAALKPSVPFFVRFSVFPF